MEILSIARSFVDLFFPKRCVGCQSVIAGTAVLCPPCAAKLSYTHWGINRENEAYFKLKALCNLNSAGSFLRFEHDNITQKLMHFLKYENHPEIGILLAEGVFSSMNLAAYDGIIPVPIHPKKLKKRGYNQVMPFAERLAELTGIPLVKDCLIRKENNPSQVHKSREERLNSIRNAFTIKGDLTGHYLLVDDVLTTGATVSSCVNLIHSKFTVKISVLTIACAV
ncbi:MAG: double zinc ribbon domain-containing protein [Moheibacter sp.]